MFVLFGDVCLFLREPQRTFGAYPKHPQTTKWKESLHKLFIRSSRGMERKILRLLHSSKLTWQWKMDPLKMYFLLKMGIFHCYVSLPEGSSCFPCAFFLCFSWIWTTIKKGPPWIPLTWNEIFMKLLGEFPGGHSFRIFFLRQFQNNLNVLAKFGGVVLEFLDGLFLSLQWVLKMGAKLYIPPWFTVGKESQHFAKRPW